MPVPNLALWEEVEKTDPKFTKEYTGPGGFSGTAVNAQYLAKRATEQFGPCGTGWGYEVIEERFDIGGPLLNKEGVVLAHAHVHTLKVALWYLGGDGERKTITHYGHTPFITQNKFGSIGTDFDAPKKPLTDAIGKCLSQLGCSADVRLGLYDDIHYVNERLGEAEIERAEDKIEAKERLAAEYREWLAETLHLIGTAQSLNELEQLYKSAMRKLELQPPGKKWQDAGCVYGPKRTIAWRVLDAQYFSLAQRSRRVFVVAGARDGFDPTEVLFERKGLRQDTAPRRGEGQDSPIGTLGGTSPGGGWRFGADEAAAGQLIAFGGGANRQQTEVETALSAHPGGTRMDAETETFVVSAPLTTNPYGDHESRESLLVVAGTAQANGKAAGSATQQDAESGLLVVHGTQDPSVNDKLAFALGRNNGQENAILAFSCKDHGADAGEIAPTLRAMNHSDSHANTGGQVAMCITGDITHTLKADGFDGSEDGTGRGQPITPAASGVRRLTPCECERLQGMADDYTLIPSRGKPERECPGGPRYKAIGNSKAVTVVRWIGRRLLQQL